MSKGGHLISQVSKALSQLFRPVATGKSEADRDPSGNQFERFLSEEQKKKNQNGQPDASESQLMQKSDSENGSTNETPTAQIIPFVQKPTNEAIEVQKKAIGLSQAWIGLKEMIRNSQESGSTHEQLDQQNKHEGTGAYEQTSTQSSKSSLSKKGVILDKKVG